MDGTATNGMTMKVKQAVENTRQPLEGSW